MDKFEPYLSRSFLNYHYLLFLFFLLPTVIIPDLPTEGKQLSVLMLIFFGFYLLFFVGKLRFNLAVACIASYLLYISIITFFSSVKYFLKITDLFDLLRVFGVLVFYVLGMSIGSAKSLLALRLLVYLSAMVFFSYLFRGGFFGGLSEFYSSEDHRFSSLVPGINYIWFPCLTIFLYSRVYLGNLFCLLSFFVVLSSLVFSASFTSIIVFLFGLITFEFLKMRFTGNRGLSSCILFLTLYAVAMISLVTLMIYISVYYEFGFVHKFYKLLEFLQTFDVSIFSSLSKRFDHWAYVFSAIQENSFIGHGPARDLIKYTDNTYLMSLFRWGLVGFIIEVLVYLVVIFYLFKNAMKFSVDAIISLSLLSAYFIAGFTSNVFYELKVPFLLFFIIGYASRSYSVIRRDS
jgi:O-antigen ligase